MKTKLLLTLILALTQALVSAQGLKLGDNPNTIDPSSLLEMESTSLVFVPTRMTTAQMNAITPLDGALIYNTTEQAIFSYDNGVWSSANGVREDNFTSIFAGSNTGENSAGSQNVAVGVGTFRLNTTGFRNTLMGNQTLAANSTGNNNSAFGFRALRNSNANSNSAFGVNALRDNQGGQSNSAFGVNALSNLVDGNNNTAFGVNSGNSNEDDSFLTDVSNSVFIGNGARSQANAQNNQIVIGHNAIGNGANSVTIGNDATTGNFFNGNVDITGEYLINGVPISGGGGTDPNVGTNNVFVGNGAGVNTALDASGRENVAMGVAALGSNVTGIRNTAVGTEALFSNITGQENTAVGNSALINTTTSGNNAFGFRSMVSNTTGIRNAAFGTASLGGLISGNDNVAFGVNAGSQIQNTSTLSTATGSVFIGMNTRANANGESNQIVLGAFVTGNGSNTVSIGNNGITDNYFYGLVHANGFKLRSLQTAPASSTAPGETGEIRIDANFIYVCVAPNSWVRAALSSW